MQMKKMIDQDLISMKQLKKLMQRFIASMSVINVYHSMLLCESDKFDTLLYNSATSTTSRHLLGNDYHRLPCIPYTQESFDRTFWKLDPTAGPNRVRMRLKVQMSKYEF